MGRQPVGVVDLDKAGRVSQAGEFRTASTPRKRGMIIANLKGSVRPSFRCIVAGSTRSISTLVIPVIPSLRKKYSVISWALPNPQIPK